MKFGRLTVLEETYVKHGKINRRAFKLRCDCGQITIATRYAVISGHTRSCKCISTEKLVKFKKTHGLSSCSKNSHPLYSVWQGMKDRTLNKNSHSYRLYGGCEIPITVCDEWRKNFTSFYEWSINNGYEKGKQLDRIDNNSGYAPENCRYVTPAVKNRNKRTNRIIKFNGEKMCLQDVSNITNIPTSTLTHRIDNGLPLLEDGSKRYLEYVIKNKNNLAIERIKKGLTQRQLAEIVGVDDSSICRWESGVYKPDQGKLNKLSEVLNVNVDDLLKKVKCE